jgi:hypothetical protein
MRASSLIAGVFVLAVVVLLVRAPTAQIATVKGQGKLIESVLLEQQDLPAQSDNEFFTVPDKRTLVITDFLVSNGGASATLVQLDKDAGMGTVNLTHPMLMPAGSTQMFNFETGIEFGPGEKVIVGSGAGDQFLSVTLSGYLRKG